VEQGGSDVNDDVRWGPRERQAEHDRRAEDDSPANRDGIPADRPRRPITPYVGIIARETPKKNVRGMT
jgi:hypothetical protein